jgi:hypothetical protein
VEEQEDCRACLRVAGVDDGVSICGFSRKEEGHDIKIVRWHIYIMQMGPRYTSISRYTSRPVHRKDARQHACKLYAVVSRIHQHMRHEHMVSKHSHRVSSVSGNIVGFCEQRGTWGSNSKIFQNVNFVTMLCCCANREAPAGRMAFRDLAQLVWALARMGRPVDPNLLEGVARTALTQLHAASPYDVSMLLWGLAKLSTLPDQVRGPDSACHRLFFFLLVYGGMFPFWNIVRCCSFPRPLKRRYMKG